MGVKNYQTDMAGKVINRLTVLKYQIKKIYLFGIKIAPIKEILQGGQ